MNKQYIVWFLPPIFKQLPNLKINYYDDELFNIIIISQSNMRQKENRFQKLRSKYAKIPLKTKVKFLRKVVVEGMSIRDVPIFEISPQSTMTSTTLLPRPWWGSTNPICSNTTLHSLWSLASANRKIKKSEYVVSTKKY